MATNKNITMKQYNGTDYDVLDQKITGTLDKLISDYNKNIIAAVVIDKDNL